MNFFGKGLQSIMKRLWSIFRHSSPKETNLSERACDYLADHPSPNLSEVLYCLQAQNKPGRIYYLSRHARKFRVRKKNQKRLSQRQNR